MIAIIAVAAMISPVAIQALGAFNGGAVVGFVVGGLSTGTFEGAIKGAIFGAISGGIAEQIGAAASLGPTGKSLAHGFTQGGINVFRGGNFKSGFLGGYLGHSIGDKLNYGDGTIGAVAARTTAMAVVGGASAKLGGGKFANGAVSGAFVYMFGEMAGRRAGTTAGGTPTEGEPDRLARGSGWLSPDDHPYVVGREGTVVPPGRGIGGFIDDYWPAGHTFGTNHDAFVGWINPREYFVVDMVVNVPSMIVIYPLSVVQEIFNTPVYLFNSFTSRPYSAPLDHTHHQTQP